MTVNLGLLGAGRIGRVHASAVAASPRARLVAVADAVDTAAQELAHMHGCDVRAPAEMETATDIDAVLVCTPTDTHAELIERFARAGKAVFCEKPIALGLDRVKACLAVVEQTGTALMIGFNRRFDPHFAAVRRAIGEGRVGEVEMVQIVSRDPGPPPAGYIASSGGIFRDMTIHDFDMARFLLGEEPETVFAAASVLVDPAIGEQGDFDSASLVLTTASGRQCAISNSRRASYGYDQRVEVLGSKGMVSAENQRPVSIELASAEGFARPPLHDFFMTRYVEAYAAEIAAFVALVADGGAVSPTGTDGLLALALAEAAVRSVETGRTIAVADVLG